MNFSITVLFHPTFIFTVFMSLLKVIDERLSSKTSNNFKIFEKENANKQELIGDCLHFYFVNLLRCVYFILKTIGAGGFGSVYLCFNGKKGYSNLYAVKCIKSLDSINSADRERRFGYVSKLNSQYLVKYHETFTFNNDLFVVMKYFKDGNLNDFIKRYQKENQRIKELVYFFFI
jgi:serine/threonine protein kinase